MVNLPVGMLGSIMAASREALVIDDEMCGAILRTVRGVEVTSEHLELEQFEHVVTGDGHFLGEPQTLALMNNGYLYPALANRQSIDDWIGSRRQTIWYRAQQRVEEILESEPPRPLDAKTEESIRPRLPIMLN